MQFYKNNSRVIIIIKKRGWCELNWVQTKCEWLEQYNPGRMQLLDTWVSTENGTRGGFRNQIREQTSL